MKLRRHHNNKGTRQIQRGKTHEFIERLAKKLGIKMIKYAVHFEYTEKWLGEPMVCLIRANDENHAEKLTREAVVGPIKVLKVVVQ
jgi:hypothetical protein